MDILSRLRRTVLSAPDIHGGRRQVPLNPDGPEAAEEVERLRRMLNKEHGVDVDALWQQASCVSGYFQKDVADHEFVSVCNGDLRRLDEVTHTSVDC